MAVANEKYDLLQDLVKKLTKTYGLLHKDNPQHGCPGFDSASDCCDWEVDTSPLEFTVVGNQIFKDSEIRQNYPFWNQCKRDQIWHVSLGINKQQARLTKPDKPNL